MSYFETYKKRLAKNSSGVLETRMNVGKRQINDNFNLIQGYKKAIVQEDCETEPREIEVVVKSANTELEKRIFFRPDTNISVGSYISYGDKTYILREIDVDQLSPKGVCFHCNRYINFEGVEEPFYCYTNSTTYGSKGIIDQDKFYELDSKTKIYIQRNKYTDTLQIGQRIMFANRYVYKITEIDDLVYSKMYIIVAQRDETLPMDDFARNLAYNEVSPLPSVDGDSSVEEEIAITGESKLKIGKPTQFYINTNDGEWSVDDSSIAELTVEDNVATLIGMKTGWVTLTYTKLDGMEFSFDIICSK